MQLELLRGELAVTRLDPASPVPAWARGELVSITRTADELSIVCEADSAPEGRRGFRGLKVRGPLEFSLIGVLASLAGALAGARIPMLAISTFDTDYILLEESHLGHAIEALEAAGHAVRR